jgi:spermidine/putrescine transport system substrate-binding protein
MGSDEIWRSELNRRQFLRGAGALGLGASALGIAAACGVSPASSTPPAANASPSLPPYPKAQIDGDLTLFNWSQYMNPDVITGFAKHYGIKVNTPYFDNMTDMLTKLDTGQPYDLTFPTMDYVDQLIAANALLPIDHTQLANWSEVPTYFNDPWYDSKATFSVPYAIWTTGIMWRSNQVSGMTGSWSDFWLQAPQYHDKMFLLDDYQEVLGMSLLRLGYDINSGKKAELDKAVAEVLKIKSTLRGLETDDITNMVNGTAWIHHAWSGDVYQVISQVSDPTNIKYETGKEGVPTGNDTMVIPKTAQHPGSALKFIDWMLDPKNAKSNIDYFGYPQVTNTGIAYYASTIGTTYPVLSMTLDQAIHGLREIAPTGDKRYLWQQEWRKIKYSG